MNSIYVIPLSPLAWGGIIPSLLSLRNINKFSHYLIASYVFSFVFIAFILFAFLFSFFIGGFLVIVVGAIHLFAPPKIKNALFIKRTALIIILMFVLPLIYGLYRLNTIYLNPTEKL
ncbi:MAG: hypothetical protein CMF23_08025 [Ignavibacteriae bacterium]|nr:hypothetical protein [Ignavibacteriota bacterium]